MMCDENAKNAVWNKVRQGWTELEQGNIGWTKSKIEIWAWVVLFFMFPMYMEFYRLEAGTLKWKKQPKMSQKTKGNTKWDMKTFYTVSQVQKVPWNKEILEWKVARVSLPWTWTSSLHIRKSGALKHSWEVGPLVGDMWCISAHDAEHVVWSDQFRRLEYW